MTRPPVRIAACARLFGSRHYSNPSNPTSLTRMRRLFVGMLSASMIVLAISCGGLGPDGDTFQVEGHVYDSVTCGGAGCTPAGNTPVAGAVVSTSIDSQTAVTDASGHFDLKSNATFDECANYMITITATGFPTYSGAGKWGIHAPRQVFGLSPPFPQNGTGRSC